MKFQTPLIEARLIRRYKRFLADIELPDGQIVTAHCANSGAMTGLATPNARIWVEDVTSPTRKLSHSWKLVETGAGHFALVDTSMANRVVEEGLRAAKLPEFLAYSTIRREVKFGDKSRIDFCLCDDKGQTVWVEVKSVTLSSAPGLGIFPDAVTERGAKHLAELERIRTRGGRAAMLYVMNRTDCTAFGIARDVDPAYASAFDKARAAGVEMFCYGTRITPQGVWLTGRLEMEPGRQMSD